MEKERSAAEASIIKQICLCLTDKQLSLIKSDDITLVASKIDSGEILLEYIRSLSPDNLFDLLIGQLNLFETYYGNMPKR